MVDPLRDGMRTAGLGVLVILWVALARGVAADESTSAPRDLAQTLCEQGDWSAAAVEYRRLALMEEESTRRNGWRWMAAYAYYRGRRMELAEAMADRLEADAPAWMWPTLLLRAEVARGDRRPAEAAFYFESVAAGAEDESVREYARRAALAARIEARDRVGAPAALTQWSDPPPHVVEAYQRYAAGRDKNPQLGGWLGIVPGLGYAYSGEYANAVRSLILNGLFIYGMWHTGREEQWGAFAFITFFEITWFSGSVYGGVDAAHRYNRRRAETAARAILGDAAWEPDVAALPIVSLRFRF